MEEYSWSWTYHESTEDGESEGYQVSAGAPSSNETPSWVSFNDVEGYGPVTVMSPLLRNRNGDWVSREINVFADSTESTGRIVFSDGTDLDVPDFSLTAIGRIDDQVGLWKSWTGTDPATNSPQYRLSTSSFAAGSPLRNGDDGPSVAVNQIARNGLFQTSSGLWRNGRILTANEILGENSKWTSPSISALSDSGNFLAGTATNTDTGEKHAVLLLKVDLAVRDDGVSIRENGNLVKVGNSLEFALSSDCFEKEDLLEDVITWEFCQLEMDGEYTEWAAFGDHATGSTFTHTTEIGGIYRVRAVVGNIGSFEFLRKEDEKGGAYNWAFGPGLKGEPDSIGVCHKQIQIDVCKEAQSFYASEEYAARFAVPAQYGFGEYPIAEYSSIRCNIFVAHRATAAGATVPAINGYFNEYPPLANEWAGIEDTSIWPGDPTRIENWPILSSAARPQPGWIIAHPNEGDAGHVAITDYDGGGIGAGTSGTVNKLFFQFWDGTSRLRYYAP